MTLRPMATRATAPGNQNGTSEIHACFDPGNAPTTAREVASGRSRREVSPKDGRAGQSADKSAKVGSAARPFWRAATGRGSVHGS